MKRNVVKRNRQQIWRITKEVGLPRLLDSLLAFFGVEIMRRAEPALVPGYKRTNNGVLPRLGVVLVVGLDGERSWIQTWPVNLGRRVSSERKAETEGGLT